MHIYTHGRKPVQSVLRMGAPLEESKTERLHYLTSAKAALSMSGWLPVHTTGGRHHVLSTNF